MDSHVASMQSLSNNASQAKNLGQALYVLGELAYIKYDSSTSTWSYTYNVNQVSGIIDLIRGFFFDLDGTLVDTHESNFHAYKTSVKKITGIDLGESLLARIKAGESSDQFLRKLLPGISDSTVIEINKHKAIEYPKYLGFSIPNSGLIGFFLSVAPHYWTALITTAKQLNANAVLLHHELDGKFSHIVYGEDVQRMKPDPEAYLIALDKSGLSPGEVIAFEDSKTGQTAAEKAGIQVVMIKDFLQ